MISETILIIILLLILIVYYYKLNYYKVIYHKSKIDNKMYLVRDMSDKNQSADMLAQIRQNILTINKYLIENKDKYKDMEPYIIQLNDKLKDKEIVIQEGADDGIYTSYSVNKGEELVFCIRSKETNRLHDINDLMYVALHEFAHIGCPELDHTPLFYKINRFLLEMATEINVYKYTNYGSTPLNYCGLMLTSNVLDIN